MNSDLKCFYVSHKDPYYKLGPFKYELKHRAPEIGLFHDFAHPSEMDKIKSKSRGHMKTTPYVVSDKAEEPYTRFRTSKVSCNIFGYLFDPCLGPVHTGIFS